MSENYDKYIAPFLKKFATPDDVSRIANLYCDRRVCEFLPHEEDMQFLRYSECFAAEARKEDALNGRSDLWALYVLLFVTCFSDLNSEDLRKCPFGPMVSKLNGEPDCLSVVAFTCNEFQALQIIYDKVSDMFLKTQIADVLWAFKKKWSNGHDVRKYAEYALNSYLQTPIDEFHWYYCSGEKRLYRAAQLQTVGSPSQSGLTLSGKIEDSLLNTDDNSYKLTGGVVRLLVKTRLQIAGAKKQSIEANLLDRLSQAIKNDDEMLVYAIRTAIEEWGRYLNRPIQMDNVHRQVAKYLSDKAIRLQSNLVPSGDGHIVGLYSGALNAYLKISSCDRNANGDDERIEDIRKGLEQFYISFQQKLVPQLKAVGPLPDYQKEIEAFLGGLNGCRAIEAFLLGLINLSYDALKKHAIEYAANSTLRLLFPITVLQDGRRVGHISPSSPVVDEETYEPSLADMTLQYRIAIELQTLTLLKPAHRYLQAHDCLPLDELEILCKQSGNVPKEHSKQVALGLYYGWCGDYWTAVSLLSPQLENSIRMRIRQSGTLTSTIQQQSLDYEKSISKLLESDDLSSIISDPLERLELSALFGSRDKNGYAYNLRNDMQHGLLNDADMDAPVIMYAWWYIFRMVLKGVVSA